MTHDTSYETALAIIGMSGRFPGARDVEAFWHNIAEGIRSIRFFSDEELLDAGADPSLLQRPNYIRAGTVVDEIDRFDAAFFGLTPREAEVMDPQHRLFLECAWEALESAAYDPHSYRGLVGVFAGSAFSTYLLNHLYPNTELMELLGQLQIDVGNDRDLLASMVSYKLNLRGPAIAVQTFCSTSLVAVHLACQSLINFECDIALAGGVAIILPQENGYLYEEGGILSPDGYCRAFDAQGQGSVMGNGLGIVALKRFREAVDDGDHIYAVIRGSAVNNDGSQRVSYTAPGLDGQANVITGALSYAGVDVETINYFEAHGTATKLGDAVELAAMIKAFRSETQKKQFCAIGSVKPNVGHLDRAAGVTGLMKTALALHHKQLPPSLNFEHSNPDLDLENSPFYVNTHLREWTANEQGTPRRAGVSSFGLGGTNVHVVIEEAPERELAVSSRPWQLLLLSTHSATTLQAATTNLATHIRTHEDISLPDIAYTLQVGRAAFNHRRMVVCRDRQEALNALESGITETTNQSRRDRPVAFLFSDEGEQYAGMSQELYQHEGAFRDVVDHCGSILKTRFGIDLHKTLYSLTGSRSNQTTVEQSFIFTVEYALAHLLISWGIRPSAMLGHGVGEYVAACLSGVLTLEDALILVVCRAQLLQEGATLAVATSEVEARHLTFNAPQIPYISNVTGTWITAEQATDPTYWAQHICQAVRFSDGAGLLLQREDYVLLEVGPGHTPDSLVTEMYGSERSVNILSTLPTSEGNSEEATLLTALGQLWLAGVTIDWSGLYVHERRYRLPLPTYPFERQRYWIDPPQKQAHPKRREELFKGKKPDLADWFYLPTWQHVALPPASRTVTPAPWLIFEDNLGFGQHIAQRLLTEGHTVIRVQRAEEFAQLAEDLYTLRPGETTDYTALLGTLASSGQQPGDILHCWSITCEDETAQTGAEHFRTLQASGFYSLLSLARALGVHPSKDTMRILVVSNGMQAVSEQEVVQPEKATLIGVCKVLSQENMNITCRSIDLVASHVDGMPDVQQIDQLLIEVTSSATDPVVLYREGRRWVQTYEARRLASASTESKTKSLRHRGIYLITGGLGGVGLVLAGYLARTMQAQIVLVGRSAFPERGAWETWLQSHNADDRVSRKIRQLQEIEAQGGDVLVLQASVADEAQMRAVIEIIYARFGELHGVIHAAGISDEKSFGLAQQIEREACEEHFQPKVYGTYTLEKVLESCRLDFCILFSSLSSVLGGLGFAAYASANLFIDAFVQRHNQTTDTAWVSINWDTWQIKDLSQGTLGSTVAEYAMTPDEGIEVLTRVLDHGDLEQVVISTGDLQTRIRQWVLLESLQESDESGSTEKDNALSSPVALPARGDYKHKLAEIWQQVLGIEQVGLYDNFFDLGGNSLIALQVVNKIRKVFRVQVPVVALFEAPTVSAMADYLQPTEPVEQEQRQFLSQRRQQARQGVGQQDIAIVSLAGRFPGAPSVEQFWHNLRNGVESITFFSDEELIAAGVDPSQVTDPNYVKARPILQDVEHFDAAFFGYSPREAELMDPQHRLFLECSWEALERAGYDPQTYEGLVGVFGGANVSTYLHELIRERELVEEKLGSIDGYQIAIGTDRDSLATSVSYKLNLRGTQFLRADLLLHLAGGRSSGLPELTSRRVRSGPGWWGLGTCACCGRTPLPAGWYGIS